MNNLVEKEKNSIEEKYKVSSVKEFVFFLFFENTFRKLFKNVC